jgi:hypothetical protein
MSVDHRCNGQECWTAKDRDEQTVFSESVWNLLTEMRSNN